MHPALLVLLAAIGLRVVVERERSAAGGAVPDVEGTGAAPAVDAPAAPDPREFARLKRQNRRMRQALQQRRSGRAAPPTAPAETAPQDPPEPEPEPADPDEPPPTEPTP